jgi:hypothetical protein
MIFPSVSECLAEIIGQAFPDSARSRVNLINEIKASDEDFRNRVVNFFQNKSWSDIDFLELYNIFKEDCSAAFYVLPLEESVIFLPSILMYTVIDNSGIPGFEYVLENILLGGDVDGVAGVAEYLSREQLAVALAVLTYVSVKQWQFPDCQKFLRMRSAVENPQRIE